jgi:hypothetical protein
VDEYKWELYNVAEDFSESVNLADKEPARLRELQDLFWIEAAKCNVLPLDNSKVERFDVNLRPSLTRGRSVFTYYAGQTRIPEGAAPDLKNKSWRIGADVEIPTNGAEGVILTQADASTASGFICSEASRCFTTTSLASLVVRSQARKSSRPASMSSWPTSSMTAAALAKVEHSR